MSSPPTIADLKRLVTQSFQSGEFAEQVDATGLTEYEVVTDLSPSLTKLWETAASQLVELQKLQHEFDNAVARALEQAVTSQQSALTATKFAIFGTIPGLAVLYLVLRYVHSSDSAWASLFAAPGWVLVLVMISLAALSVAASLWHKYRDVFVTLWINTSTISLVYLALRFWQGLAQAVVWSLSVRWWIVLIAMFIVFAVCLSFYNTAKEAVASAKSSNDKIKNGPEFESYRKHIADQQKLIDDVIIAQGIKPRIRELLEALLALPFSEHLPKLDFKGLSEVFNSANEVATEAKRQLEFMLNSMPGGSIGIAGPRGSGKSTLLQSACKERPDNLTKWKVIPLLTTSPVEYDGRDFILHLFSSMCDKILDLTTEKGSSRSSIEGMANLNRSATNATLGVLAVLARPALFVGVTLITISVLLAVLTMSASQGPAANAQPTDTPETNNQPAATPSPAPSATPSAVPTPGRVIRFVEALDLKPGTLFVWGLISSISAMIILILIDPRDLLRSFFTTKIEGDSELVENIQTDMTLKNLKLDKETEELLVKARDRAREWLRDIKFQQSYTSGWSGALKLPVGLEGGMNDAVTLAQQQLSLPDITKGFSSFVRAVGRDFKVIIGIDELDKLESDESAQRFLNEIKAVFGLANVFYLISVSENAMSNFERRGVPFRDVFDSSFDNIVYVDYLTLEYARRLIARRVTAMPPPFVHLCYCISGGLARDLVRTCRNLMQYSRRAYETDEQGADSNLKFLSAALIESDLRLKLHAVTVVAKKLSPGLALDAFLNTLQSLESQLKSAPALIDAYRELLKAGRPATEEKDKDGLSVLDVYNKLKQRLSGDEPNKSDDKPLRALHEELATYIYYCVTVLQFFADVLNAQTMVKAEQDKVFDGLARARQYLAINASITRAMLDRFRHSFNMDVPVL